MNSREIMTENARLAAERGWAPGSPCEAYLLWLLTARENARRVLASRVTALRHDLDHVERMLRQESPLLNTLGELQQRPAAVEAAVGAFTAAAAALDEFLAAFPAKAG